jgi:hypothetical protein
MMRFELSAMIIGGKMKKIILVLLAVLFVQPLFSGEGTVLSELTYPISMMIEQDNLIINEKSKVFIYSLKDFKLVTSFGSLGEGPREFMISNTSGFPTIRLGCDDKHIYVTSLSKLSLFTLNGEFEKEKKILPHFLAVTPLGDHYAVWDDFTDQNGNRFRKIHIFDNQLTKIKEISKSENNLSMKNGLQFYKSFFKYVTYKGKIYIATTDEILIDVFDEEGKKLFAITHEYEKQAVKKEDKDERIDSLKIAQPRVYDYFRDKIFFPEFFPGIRDFIVTNDKIYLFTHKKNGDKSECLILDLKGKLIETIELPLKESGPRKWFPYTIKNNNVYQIVESESTNNWELNVSDIK